jgi:drug/metabolite transporter (DMT)-like permease
MIKRTGLGIACALSAAAMYGLVPNFVRSAFENGVPPIENTLFRTFLLAVAFAVIAVAQGERLAVPRAAIASFATQCVATLLVSVGYLASVQFIKVGLAVIIFYFFPVLIMLCAPLVEGRTPGFLRLMIAVLAFAGLAVAIGPDFESLDIRGILLATAATVGAALQFFSGRSISKYMTPSVFGSLVHIAIMPAVLAVAIIAGGGKLQIMPGGTANFIGLTFMVALAVLYVIAYMIQMLSLRFAPASTVAPYYNLEPVVATLAAVVLLGERLQSNQYVGGGLVLAALLLPSLVGRWKK